MNALVGYTGFVGSNIYLAGTFDCVYNSKNIKDAYGTSPEMLIYSGIRAEKYLANTEPDKDMELIRQAEYNIARINPNKLVLISTIDVFKNPKDVDENTDIDTVDLHAYGYNRYQLELWVREHYNNALIIRLPGLFGKNIKKNFIYDYINVIPYMLREDKYIELCGINSELSKYYFAQDNGFYKLNVTVEDREHLKKILRDLGFSALNFTDSRSRYQFYNLARLWDDIKIAIDEGITLWHPATEPISAGELYKYLSGDDFVNELGGDPADYDYKTIYAGLFGGHDGYINDRIEVMRQIKDFIKSY